MDELFIDKRDGTVINTTKQEVISINPNDAFTNGLQYTFFVKNENGSMKLKEVLAYQVDVVKCEGTPYYEESKCLPSNKFSWVLWIHQKLNSYNSLIPPFNLYI